MTSANFIIQRESDALRLANITDIYQSYKCVRMEEVPAFDDCNGLKAITTVYRSADKLPVIYQDTDGLMIRRIISLDNFRKIQLTTPDHIRRMKSDTNAKYDKTIYGYIKDRYLYLTRKIPIELDAFFEEDVHSCDSENLCTPYLDREWWMSRKLQDAIISDVVAKLANSYKRIPDDAIINKNPNM